MPRNRLIIVVISALIIILVGSIMVWARKSSQVATPTETITALPAPAATTSDLPTTSPSATPTPTPVPPTPTKASIIEPTQDFKSRITKKSFGTKVSPDNSPVQPEKFSGYHTGVDVEFGDVPSKDITVKAISDGKVVTSRTASGYGGVVAIQHTLDGKAVVAVYGHLDPGSMVKNGVSVKAGEIIGILGEGGTSETDGERKHLHLSFVKGSTVNIKGYVQAQAELSGWYDPLDFF